MLGLLFSEYSARNNSLVWSPTPQYNGPQLKDPAAAEAAVGAGKTYFFKEKVCKFLFFKKIFKDFKSF